MNEINRKFMKTEFRIKLFSEYISNDERKRNNNMNDNNCGATTFNVVIYDLVAKADTHSAFTT